MMMRRKVLFVISSFTVGGTSTSLLNLISLLPHSDVDFSVYALTNDGPLRDEMSKWATIVNDGSHHHGPTKKRYLKTKIFAFAKKIYRLLRKRKVNLSTCYYKHLAKKLDDKHYDCIIAYQEGNVTEAVSFCNTKKVAWIHSDYSRFLKLIKSSPQHKLYQGFDKIINVSEMAKKKFDSVMPECSYKSFSLYNAINVNRIQNLANEHVDFIFEPGVFHIISIGRLDPVKRFDRIPEIALSLKKMGLKFKWLLVGGSTVSAPMLMNDLQNEIQYKGLQKEVCILGNIPNPYPVLKKCNLLVCLSASETFNYTIAEARVLGVPVLSADYEGVDEFLTDRKGGVVARLEDIPQMIGKIIRDKSFHQSLKQGIPSYKDYNETILNRFLSDIVG